MTIEPVREPWTATIVSWLCLFLAAGLYAATSLAPRIQTYLVLRQDYREQQAHLVAIERQVRQLGRTITALETDPQFAAAVARLQFETGDRLDEQRIPLDDRLAVDPEALQAEVLPEITGPPWHAPIWAYLAGNELLRQRLLTASAVLVIGAFLLPALPTGEAPDRIPGGPHRRPPETSVDSAKAERLGGSTLGEMLRARYGLSNADRE